MEKKQEVKNRLYYLLYKSGLTAIWQAIRKYFLEHQKPIHTRRPLKVRKG